jgi:hypothetical protein
MRQPQHPKRQHYVPRLLLRGFVAANTEQVYVFDKQDSRVFRTSIRKIASERAFYDLDIPDGLATLEPALADLESKAGPIIDGIRKARSVAGLSEADAVTLALFAMVQHQRTVNFRAKVGQMNADMAAWLRKLGHDPNTVKGFKEFDDEELRAFSLFSVARAHELVPHLLDKAWLLFARSPSKTFYIGDNPIAMQNHKDFGFYGNIGLAVPGIEIYLPLSSDLTLAWYSASFVKELGEGLALAEKLKIEMPSETARIDELSARPGRILAAMSTGDLVYCEGENVVNLNSLQVRYAERYVYSREGDFDLAREMVAKHPSLRSGPRGQVG